MRRRNRARLRGVRALLSSLRRQGPDPSSRAPKLRPSLTAPKSYVATSPSSSARRDAAAAAATAPLALRDFRDFRFSIFARPSPAESSTPAPRSTAAFAAAKNPAAAGIGISFLGGDQGSDGPEGSTSSTDASGRSASAAPRENGLAPPPP